MLLDTHVWIWAVDGGARLGTRIRRRLAKHTASGSYSDAVWVSAASVFEIVALHTAGRLQFTQPVERWLRESIERGGLRVIGFEHEIAIDAGMIPAAALPDPIDRCLVATARDLAVPLVTADRRILSYADDTRLVRVVDANA